jgi:hypothetical protein
LVVDVSVVDDVGVVTVETDVPVEFVPVLEAEVIEEVPPVTELVEVDVVVVGFVPVVETSVAVVALLLLMVVALVEE